MLFEAMIASVVLAVAAVGIASLLLSSHEQQSSIQETNTATLLAKQLMEEIAAKPLGTYTAGPASGPRSAFTTACQYNGYTDSTGSTGNGIQTISGATVPCDPNYTCVVSIAGTSVSQTSPPYDVCIVTVAVTTPSGTTVSLSKWLSNVTWGF